MWPPPRSDLMVTPIQGLFVKTALDLRQLQVSKINVRAKEVTGADSTTPGPTTQRRFATNVSLATARHGRLASRGALGLAMSSSTAFRSFIAAMTVLLQSTSGTTLLAQEGQVTTARASANDRGNACQTSIEKVINLCMIRGLNNIGRVNCDCVQDGRTWTCTGTAACTK